MKARIAEFCKTSVAVIAVCVCGIAGAEPAPNPRAATVVPTATSTATSRSETNRVVRGGTGADTDVASGRSDATVSRSATTRPSTTVSRSATIQPQKSNNTVTGRAGTIRQTAPVAGNAASRSATV